MKKTLSIIAIILLVITMCISMIACDLELDDSNSNGNSSNKSEPKQDESTKTYNGGIGDTLTFANGVEFTATEVIERTELTTATRKWTTENKFVMIKVQVVNNSNDVFTSTNTDVWLNYIGAKIHQVNIVNSVASCWNSISQSATVTKSYYCVFEVGKDIPTADLMLTIWNRNYGILSTAEFVNIKLG